MYLSREVIDQRRRLFSGDRCGPSSPPRSSYAPRLSTASASTPRPPLLFQCLGRSFRRDMEGTYQHAGRSKRANTSAAPGFARSGQHFYQPLLEWCCLVEDVEHCWQQFRGADHFWINRLGGMRIEAVEAQ